MMSRRNALMAACALLPFVVAGCVSNVSVPSLTLDPQTISVVQSIVSESSVVVSTIQKSNPTALSPEILADITTAQASANALLTSLSTATPAAAGATTIQKITADVMIVLNAVGPVLHVVASVDPALAPAVMAYDLALPLVPVAISYINSKLGTPATTTAAAAAPLKPLRVAYTADEALAIIKAQQTAATKK